MRGGQPPEGIKTTPSRNMYHNYYKRYALVGRVGRYTTLFAYTRSKYARVRTISPREEQWSKQKYFAPVVVAFIYISARGKKGYGKDKNYIPRKRNIFNSGIRVRIVATRFQWYCIISSQPGKLNTERGLIRAYTNFVDTISVKIFCIVSVTLGRETDSTGERDRGETNI